MNKRLMSACLLIVLTSGFHWWDPVARWMGIGNDALSHEDLETAETAYNTALKNAGSLPEAEYNLGLVEAAGSHPEKAQERFTKAATSSNPELKSNALYNQGCLDLQNQQFDAAAKRFTEALKLNPQDQDAKVNLEMALQMLNMQTPPPQNQDQQNQDQNGNTEPTPESGDSETPESTPTPSDSASAARNGAPTPSPTPRSGEPQPKESGDTQDSVPASATPRDGELTPEEAERLLDALEDQEMEVLKRFHQLPKPEKTIDKDW